MGIVPIVTFIISLIGFILLSIFNKRLKSKTVTIVEYILMIITIIGFILLFFYWVTIV